MRLDSKKPQQVPIDSSIHFGASTRTYIIRERPQSKLPLPSNELSEDVDGNLLGLPDTEVELDVSLMVFVEISCVKFTIK